MKMMVGQTGENYNNTIYRLIYIYPCYPVRGCQVGLGFYLKHPVFKYFEIPRFAKSRQR